MLDFVPNPRPSRARVISASKRTDIPAFYLPWLAERVQAGEVAVPNPMFRNASEAKKAWTHVSLKPDDVAAIVWWSKNYGVYLRPRFYEVFGRYPVQYFHFTVNSRRPDLAWLEPDVPSEAAALVQIEELARRRGPEMIAWRNDPIMFWYERGENRSSWDPEFFERMCKSLSGMGVTTCFTSIADAYRKFVLRLREFFPEIQLRDPTSADIQQLGQEMGSIAAAYGMELHACTESALAGQPGFTKGACIDGKLLRATQAAATDRKMKGREECGCTRHIDIGDYVTQECGYSCVYCYANPNHKRYDALAKWEEARGSGGSVDGLKE